MGWRIGVDLGGTKIEAAALDASGAVRLRRRVATPGGYDATLAGIAALVEAAEAELGGRASLGIGIPGSENPQTRLIRGANSTFLNGRPLGADLEARLGRPMRMGPVHGMRVRCRSAPSRAMITRRPRWNGMRSGWRARLPP